MLGLPSYCHVHHFPSGARIRIAYHILHIIHVLHHVACAFPVIDCGSVACVLVLGRAGRRVRERGTCWVRLRGSSFRQLWEPCRQDDHTLEITSIFALLVVRSIAILRYLPLAISCLPYCHVKSLTILFLANRCLAKLPLLLSPSYSVASCRWSWSWFHVGTWRCCSLLEHVYLLGYHNISYLINASIYLVKGGRLVLMPGVLFHSCRPSFRHTGVMFLDFVFLTRLGVMGTPW